MSNINSISIIIGWIAIVLLAATLCRHFFPTQKELSRKIVHIGTGPIIPFAWWLNIPADVAITASVLITVGLFINYQLKWLPAIEDIQRQSYGTVAYALSITILLILFWPQGAAAISAGILVMAFADGFAGLIGRQIKSPHWMILGQRKSVAGTITMALVGLLMLLLIAICNDMPIYPIKLIMITSLAVGLEQISIWGIDNLTVPISVAFAWNWMMNLG